jgi:hypothetical protein
VRTKTTIAVLVLVLVFYSVLIGIKAVQLLGSGSRVGQLFGVALLVMPLLGLYVVWREIDFGRRTSVLGKELARRGRAPCRRPAPPSVRARGPAGRGRSVRADAAADRGEPRGLA